MTLYQQKSKKSVCCTVGELKKAIAEIDDTMPISSSFEDAVSVVVMQNAKNESDTHLSIDDTDELTFEQWCCVLNRRAVQASWDVMPTEGYPQDQLKRCYEDGMSPEHALHEL